MAQASNQVTLDTSISLIQFELRNVEMFVYCLHGNGGKLSFSWMVQTLVARLVPHIIVIPHTGGIETQQPMVTVTGYYDLMKV